MRIDVHAHYWAASYINLLIELGSKAVPPMAAQPDDLEDRLAVMDSVGVDHQIFSAIGLNTELPDPVDAVTATQHINDLYLEINDRFDGRFLGFASVPLPHIEEAIAETERMLGHGDVIKGIALPCSVDGKAIDHPDFEPFWANLARHGRVAVYIHPVGSNSAPHPGLADWNLGMAYGSPLQISVAPVRIFYSGLSTRYPDLQFIFALCGGNLPFMWNRQERAMKRGIEARAAAGGRGPNPYQGIDLDPQSPLSGVKRFWYDCSTQDVPLMLRAVTESFGADRLLLGSDETHASLVEAVSYIQDSEYLTEAQKTDILDHNAQSFLQLPQRSALSAR